jgi:hypothetical protein
VHKDETGVLREEPFRRSIEQYRPPLAVDHENRFRKSPHRSLQKVSLTATCCEFGPELAGALQMRKQRDEAVLVSCIKSRPFKRPKRNQATNLFAVSRDTADETMESALRPKPMAIELRSDEFPIRHQFGARKHLRGLEKMFGMKPDVLPRIMRAVEFPEARFDTGGVADLTLMGNEIVFDESNDIRVQRRTKPCRDFVPEGWITGRVMREMDNLAARWIHLHRAFRSRLKTTGLAVSSGFRPVASRPLA